MLTLFTTPKPFNGHIGTIQRNALESWTRLDRDVEIILFGDEDGAAQTAQDLSIRHEKHVERNAYGLKRVDYLFDRAQEMASGDLLCYVNCDIVLLDDFVKALEQTRSRFSKFLMVGRRWDTDITKAIDFSVETWAEGARRQSLTEGQQRDAWAIDYFAFHKGLYQGQVPPLVNGRIYWDNWLLWRALDLGAAMVDASRSVVAIHQNHDYGYHPKGREGVWNDELAKENLEIAGGFTHLRNIEDANFILDNDRFRRNYHRYFLPTTRRLRIWFFVLDITRPIRSVMGLRRRKQQTARDNGDEEFKRLEQK